MKLSTLLGLLSLVATPLTAQTIDTLGATTTPVTQTATGKANLFRVDTTVYLTNLEMYLNVPGVETLTFFMHRHHSQDGTYTLEWTASVPVNGTGIGPAWYSAGQVVSPLVAGNHYMIGVAWPGSVTYYYKTATSGQPISFGAWHRGTTPRYPPPATFSIAGVDIAQYYQRLTTVPLPAVVPVGVPCSGSAGAAPRLVATRVPQTGAAMTLEVVNAAPSAPAIYLLAGGQTLTTPFPVLNCLFWLNLSSGPLITVAVGVGANGQASLQLTIPQDPSLTGAKLQTQAAVIPANLDLTNALQLTIT